MEWETDQRWVGDAWKYLATVSLMHKETMVQLCDARMLNHCPGVWPIIISLKSIVTERGIK
ncbi:MAG: hypothetical protein ABI813_01080 [Bacteroidota bacterium]